MADRAKELGVALRPHVKTAKCAEVTKLATEGQAGGICVSTLKEANYFFEQGFTDMILGVGIVPAKLASVDVLQSRGAHVRVILDNPETARMIAEKVTELSTVLDVMIEIDSGGRRGGVQWSSPSLIEIGRIIDSSTGLNLVGVLSHAGHSYLCKTEAELIAVAEQERFSVASAAEQLREAGLPCPIVSVGATPTALFAEHLKDITEMRPGVYTLFDVTQSALGCCSIDDIAVSVLASIIGHGSADSYALVDAGALALSQDRSAEHFSEGAGYGIVFDEQGKKRCHDVNVSNVNQEHGFLRSRSKHLPYSELAIGSRMRIFPNHSCMTAAPYDKYYVVDGSDQIVAVWDKLTGW